MPLRDPHNRSRLWTDPDIAGLLLMRADFTTQEFAPHFHDELVIAVTEGGGAEFRSRGVRESVEPGTVLVFNPGEPHSGRMGRSRRWRYRAYYLGAPAVTRLARAIDVVPETLPHFASNKLSDLGLSRRLLALHHEAERGGSLLEKETGLLVAAAGLLVRHGTPGPRLPRLGDERSAVARTVRYLSENFAESVSLDALAALSGLSTFHLIRSFNKEIGISPHAFLTQLRLRHARDLLGKGTPPAEVAVAVGLYDQSALSRHFKRAFGITPGQYVEALR